MATRAVPESWLLCPHCGRRMCRIEVAVPTPPFTMELIGCKRCGITTNEFSPAEVTPQGRESRYGSG